MQQLDVLHLVFEQAIAPWEIGRFKQQFLQSWKDAHQLPSLRNARLGYYPKVQFKVRHYFEAFRPMILILGPEACLLDHAINSGLTQFPEPVLEKRTFKFPLKEPGASQPYELYKYQALNGENYTAFNQITNAVAQLDLLKRILTSHLLTFARGIGWQPQTSIQVKDLTLKKSKPVSRQGIAFECFDLSFATNLFLPEFIGCGNDVSSGFGVIRQGRDLEKGRILRVGEGDVVRGDVVRSEK